MSFIHLHLHSDYSLLDGVGTCEEYARLSRQYRMEYLTVTDHGMMAAVPAQTKACQEYGLKPIYGTEAYLNDYHHMVPGFKDLSDEDKEKCRPNAHLVMWAKDQEGYKNLVRISSDAWIEGFYYRPRTRKEFLRKHSGGVVASSACLAGEIPNAIVNDDFEKARRLLNEYREIFDDFFLEFMLLDFDRQRLVNEGIVRLSKEEDCPIILTNDVHFELLEDTEIQKIALLIQSREGTIANPKGLQYDAKELWFKSEEQLDEYYQELFIDNIPRDVYEQAKANTLEVCKLCEGVEIDTSPKLPQIDDAERKLFELLDVAMKARGLDGKPEYRDRLAGELDIIREKGFASYFLIMKEIIDYAKEPWGLNSLVGPGRGSGPGFLVNYLLNMCTVDPIQYGLLSERFLSPHRGGKFAKLKFSKDAIRRG